MVEVGFWVGPTMNNHCHPPMLQMPLIWRLHHVSNWIELSLKWCNADIPYANKPLRACASMFPMKNHENLLLVSSCLYHRVMVYRPAGMKPDSHKLFILALKALMSSKILMTYPNNKRVIKKDPNPCWKAWKVAIKLLEYHQSSHPHDGWPIIVPCNDLPTDPYSRPNAIEDVITWYLDSPSEWTVAMLKRPSKPRALRYPTTAAAVQHYIDSVWFPHLARKSPSRRFHWSLLLMISMQREWQCLHVSAI